MQTDETQDLTPQDGSALEIVDDGICADCKITPALQGYPSKLCYDCRQKYIKHPIPKWIWGFAIILLALMIGSMWRMPEYFALSMHMVRAEKAVKEHKFVTAQREAQQVVAKLPDHTMANAHLLISAAYNLDLQTAFTAFGKLENNRFTEGELYDQLTDAMNYIGNLLPDDTTIYEKAAAIKDSQSAEALYATFDVASKDGKCGIIAIANKMYDMAYYKRTEEMLQRILDLEPAHYSANGLMVPTKRNLGDRNSALAICDKLLEVNKEDVDVLSSKSRVELKFKNDAAAEKYAKQVLALDSKNLMAKEALAMVAYYKGNKNESDKLLAEIKAVEVPTGNTEVSDRLTKVLNNTEPYR